MNKIVLQIRYGGLGDHLFYSHIPRIAKESGKYEKVMLSTKSEFRHPDYRKLVWESNPYFDGFTEELGVYSESSIVGPDENLLDRIMINLGLDDGIRWHEPELYYTATRIPAMDGKVIYDPNYVSYVGNIDPDGLKNFLSRNKFEIDYKMKSRIKYVNISAGKEIETANIEDFCNLIVSCKDFYCLSSGAATLAAALRRPAVVFWGNGQDRKFHHSKLHTYIMIKPPLTRRIYEKIKSQSNRVFCKIKNLSSLLIG